MVVWLSLICLNAKDFINSQIYNSRLLFLQYFNWNCFTCNNKKIESIFIIWLNRRSGKMKRIMCFDRLTERARRAHLAPARDFPHWSRKKSSLYDQMHDKFFIDEAWLVKLASFFFFAFLLTSTSSWSIKTQNKKSLASMQSIISWSHVWSITHYITYVSLFHALDFYFILDCLTKGQWWWISNEMSL